MEMSKLVSEGSSSRKTRGELRTGEEPDAGMCAQPIAQPTHKVSSEETQQRTQRLLVGDMERGVTGGLPQPGDGQSQLRLVNSITDVK